MLRRLLLLLIGIPFFLNAQNPNKKQLDHSDFDVWKKISQPRISNNGKWSTYSLTVERGNPVFFIRHNDSKEEYFFERGTDGRITADSKYVIFNIKPSVDSVRAMKRRKVKKKDMPLDTLCIFDLQTGQAEKIPRVTKYKIPKKWSGWLAYKMKPSVQEKKDSTKSKKKSTKSFLIIKQLGSDFEEKIPEANAFLFAEEGEKLLLASESKDSLFAPGVYLFDCPKKTLHDLYQAKGVYKSLQFDKKGTQAAFLGDLDTTDAKVRPFKLFYWNDKENKAEQISPLARISKHQKWEISEFETPRFSDDGSRLFFGIQTPPILEDTTLLEEDKVNVEVWAWTDGRLHTQQETQLKKDKEHSYTGFWDLQADKVHLLNEGNIREVRFDANRTAPYAIASDKETLRTASSWEGFPEYHYLYQVDLKTGIRKAISKEAIKAVPKVSPGGKYFYWFNAVDTVWQTYANDDNQLRTVSDNKLSPFYDELNDRPMVPTAYGLLGWTKDDKKMLVYDRYDIWLIDPKNEAEPQRLTNGRSTKNRFRYIRTDPEEQFIDIKKQMLLSVFNDHNKSSGYATYTIGDKKPKIVVQDDFRYNIRPQKAKNADRYLFTKENFEVFPDLLLSDRSFKNPVRLSDANPQQQLYSWGSIELYEWIANDGQVLQGLLVKPENFDPNRQYPLIVNFYERNSDRLHHHRAPYPHRSTINYAFYASRGYVIFNPDITYKVGYPGESAENCVLSGTTALIKEGFIDKDRIGVQGHSWGGYQIAHLITRSNLFRCAESGAPVVNMFSAYGGIRWGSGLSRMFQYEKTQSRIGGTIWEKHTQYLENSPLFFADKIETPVLILHNDKDGAVPWYQGIEFFVALRRLGKPAWLLNYNDEPHWPLKRQNRLDFNIRMQQFFDHYLMDKPMPKWMERGVPAIEKGILQGLELKE